MNTIAETEEIEAPAYLDDPKVLAYLKGTDADMDRLVLDDGKLWAYSKRSPEALCRVPLLDMVALAFPKYAQTPQTAAEPSVAPEVTTALPASLQRPKAHQRAGGLPCAVVTAPVTGTPRGLLAAFKSGKTGGRPMIKVDGKRVPCPSPSAQDGLVRVAVAAHQMLLGYALLPRAAYNLLVKSSLRPDTLMFNLTDGVVTTRVRKDAEDPFAQPVDALLRALGSDSRITFVEGAAQ